MSSIVYALYDYKQKAYITAAGYYGNECNIWCFPTKESAEKHIATYYSGQPIKVKSFKERKSI